MAWPKEEALSAQHATAIIAAETTEVRWLERVVTRHPAYRVALSLLRSDLSEDGSPPGALASTAPGLRLDLVIASLGALARSDLAVMGEWQSAFSPSLGIVAITPPVAMLGTCALAALGVRHHLIAPLSEHALSERLTDCLPSPRRSRTTEAPREQREVDLVLQAALAMLPRPGTTMPKGFTPRTRDVVMRELRRLGAATAQQLAEATGLSRVSVRRYLDLLERHGVVAASHAYGAPGRPPVIYEPVSAPQDSELVSLPRA